MAVDGLTTMRSAYGPEEMLRRLEAEIRSGGMMVFAHVGRPCRVSDNR